MSNHFGKTNDALNHLCFDPYLSGGTVVNNILATIRYSKNTGQLTYLGFCQDGSDSFNGVYSCGYSFNGTSGGDHTLKFTSSYTIVNPIIHVICFVPALVSLENGELHEILG